MQEASAAALAAIALAATSVEPAALASFALAAKFALGSPTPSSPFSPPDFGSTRPHRLQWHLPIDMLSIHCWVE